MRDTEVLPNFLQFAESGKLRVKILVLYTELVLQITVQQMKTEKSY